MLYWLSALSDVIAPLSVLRYISFRTGGATITALLFVFIFGPWIIDHLRLRQGKGQPIGSDSSESHLITKESKPTMGGLMILLGIVVSIILWANPANYYVWIVLGVTLTFGAIGFYGDHLKVIRQPHARFSGKLPMAAEGLIAAAACYFVAFVGREPFATSLIFPFFKELILPLGWFIVVGAFVIVGAGNAANLIDDLDGRAIVPVIIAALCFGFVSYLAGNSYFAEQFNILYLPGTGELAVVCGAAIGAGLSFLWFNALPASILMGDAGSLALGGMMGTIAVATKREIVLAVVGGLFVLVKTRFV